MCCLLGSLCETADTTSMSMSLYYFYQELKAIVIWDMSCSKDVLLILGQSSNVMVEVSVWWKNIEST